jgi:hypothetical protein
MNDRLSRMNPRPPKLPRMRNIAVTLLMLAAMITLIVFALRAESRLVCGVLFLMAFALLPFIVARAFQDDAYAYANREFDKLCEEKEAAALKRRPGPAAAHRRARSDEW